MISKIAIDLLAMLILAASLLSLNCFGLVQAIVELHLISNAFPAFPARKGPGPSERPLKTFGNACLQFVSSLLIKGLRKACEFKGFKAFRFFFEHNSCHQWNQQPTNRRRLGQVANLRSKVVEIPEAPTTSLHAPPSLKLGGGRVRGRVR